MSRTVKCPTCGKPVEWSDKSSWRPFCSDRCRLIDLGEWADESRRIPAERNIMDESLSELDRTDETTD
jgi:endogenous inhibitor of DNA gyrase (YacG/DUF329 family)